MRGIALFCAAASVAGCSLLLSTSDLAETNGSVDGGAPPAEPPADAPSSASDASDAGSSVDAPSDGGSFCNSLSPAPKFCSDFTGSAALLPEWDDIALDPPSSTSVTKEDGTLVTKLTNAPSCSYSRLEKRFAVSGNGMRIALSMRPMSPFPNDRIVFVVYLEGTDENDTCGLLFHVTPTEARTHFQYGEPQQDDQFAWTDVPPIGAWSRVLVELVTSGVAVSVDGNKVSAQAFPVGCGLHSSVVVGLGYHCGSGNSEIRFDDVTVDYP